MYNNTGAYDAALQRLDNTKNVENRDPFFSEGENVVMLLELQPFVHLTHGPSVRATFEILESRTSAIGSRVCKLWFLCKPSKFPSQPTDADRFADFVRKMSGKPDGTQVGQICAALLRDRVNEQLLRGMVIRGTGVQTSKNPAKPFVDVQWGTVVQTQDEIRHRRAGIDAKFPVNAAPAAYVAPAPMAAYTAPVQAAPAAPAAAPAAPGTLLSQIPGF